MWFHAAMWGLFGSFAVEGLDLWAAVRRWGVWPWRVIGPREVGALGYFVAELIRLVIGGGLAAAAMLSGQITTPLGALAVGVAAPLIVERLTRSINLTDSTQATAGGKEQAVLSSTEQQQLPDQVASDKRLPSSTRRELDGQRAPVEENRSGGAVKQVASENDQARE